jgi:hypothetical protein
MVPGHGLLWTHLRRPNPVRYCTDHGLTLVTLLFSLCFSRFTFREGEGHNITMMISRYHHILSHWCIALVLCFTGVQAKDMSLLMVGNSFTDANNLEVMLQTLLEEDAFLGTKDVYAMRFKKGASRFAEHANSSELKSMVAEWPWTWVVLQEQSEIPGFWETFYDPTLTLSIESAIMLNDWISADHADTVLLMTWGRLTYDTYYPDIFPDFETMQSRVAEGYYRTQKAISTATRPVKIAPAGLAFKRIHDSYRPIGEDPATHGTDFFNLYADDGVHPSVEGSYLVACVLYATLTGHDVTRLQWAPNGFDATLRDRLQSVAASTVDAFNRQNSFNGQASSKESSEETKRPYTPEEDPSPSRRSWIILPLALVATVSLVFAKKRGMVAHSEPSHVAYTDNVQAADLELVELQKEDNVP